MGFNSAFKGLNFLFFGVPTRSSRLLSCSCCSAQFFEWVIPIFWCISRGICACILYFGCTCYTISFYVMFYWR